MRKKCSSDREKLFKFEAEARKFAKILRSQEQFIQTEHFLVTECFFKIVPGGFSDLIHLTITMQIERKIIGI